MSAGGYPGGKAGAGVYQKIINLMPPHDVYIEPFLGGGAIMRRKRPAASSIVIDREPGVLADFAGVAGIVAHCGDAVPWLRQAELHRYWAMGRRVLIYADPPYVMSSRKGGALYTYEMTDDQHRVLVSVLMALSDRGVHVMVSGYRHPIYDALLAGAAWRATDFWAQTRRGMAKETIWFNFEPPAVPHDLAYVGETFRDRENIKRQQARWRRKFMAMPAAQRAAMLATLAECAVPVSSVGNADVIPSAPLPVGDGPGRPAAETLLEYWT